jgi:uncharacterized BrkB/YihY/UPF0761 family membrane protein
VVEKGGLLPLRLVFHTMALAPTSPYSQTSDAVKNTKSPRNSSLLAVAAVVAAVVAAEIDLAEK